MTRQDTGEGVISRPWIMRAAALLAALAGALGVQAMTAAAASADGTVTVVVQGKGDVSGSGIDCDESGGPDCSEFHEDDQVCDPDLKPPCHDVPAAAFLTAANRAGTGFVFDHWVGCDDDEDGDDMTCERAPGRRPDGDGGLP